MRTSTATALSSCPAMAAVPALACLLLLLAAAMVRCVEDAGEEDCSTDLCSLDVMLTMPPPPIPPFMLSVMNDSFAEDGCNLCRLFSDSQADVNGSGFLLPRPSDKSTESPAADGVASVLAASILGLSFGALLLGLIWCKKWRHMHVKGTCPLFGEGGLGGQRKAAPPPPSPAESVLAPVVNEKSPQSIIMDHGTSKRSVIHTKYWRRGSDLTLDASSSVLRPRSEHYAGDGSSCTSSPVYAELDGVPAAAAADAHGSGLLVSCPASSISPYAVGMNTYSELPDNCMRMTNLTSSAAALLPDSSYDNAAYLPNMNADHYSARSLRRTRAGASGLPLLHASGSQQQFTAQVLASPGTSAQHLTRKRGRAQQQGLAQQLARSSVQRMQDIDLIDDLSCDRNRFTGRRAAASSSQSLQT